MRKRAEEGVGRREKKAWEGVRRRREGAPIADGLAIRIDRVENALVVVPE